MAGIQLSLFPELPEEDGRQKRVIIQLRSKKKEHDPSENFGFSEAQMRVFEELSRSMWGPKPGGLK